MRTSVNAKPCNWEADIHRKWDAASNPDAEELDGAVIVSSNYFTPRPWRNEYDRGCGDEGFCFVTSRRGVYTVTIKTHTIERA